MVDGRDRRAVQPVEHEHYFRRARVLDAHGVPFPEGRRCACGSETVGDPGINAQLVRASQRMNAALAKGAQQMVTAIEQVDLPGAAARDLARINRVLRAARDRVREP